MQSFFSAQGMESMVRLQKAVINRLKYGVVEADHVLDAGADLAVRDAQAVLM